MMIRDAKSVCNVAIFLWVILFAFSFSSALDREEKRQQEQQAFEEQFKWWPTDARPCPVKDERGGYWWWPKEPGPGSGDLWGNRGYCYVRKIIFDYKEEELPPPKPQELRPSLLIKKIIRNVKVYFDFDKTAIRDDSRRILSDAVRLLRRNPDADILITGNCDARGSENYNLKLGRERAEAVKQFMLAEGIPEERIRIISRGKLDAIAPVTDLAGMQKDRNAQFMVAEVEEMMIPYEGGEEIIKESQPVEEGKYIQEKQELVEGEVNVSTKEYVVRKGDSLSKIAQREYGKAHRWKYLYELNKDRIKNPNRLKVGQKIIIPVE